MNDNWKNLLSSVAPWLGAAIGGPVGNAAGIAIATALGTDKDNISKVLSSSTPEQLMALKQADADFAIKMQELGFTNAKDLEQIAANDRDSARKREMSVHDNTPKVLAYLITMGFFGILAFMLFMPIPESSKDVMYIMIGTLGTAWTASISYYFGSTSSSKFKTDLISRSEPIK